MCCRGLSSKPAASYVMEGAMLKALATGVLALGLWGMTAFALPIFDTSGPSQTKATVTSTAKSPEATKSPMLGRSRTTGHDVEFSQFR